MEVCPLLETFVKPIRSCASRCIHLSVAIQACGESVKSKCKGNHGAFIKDDFHCYTYDTVLQDEAMRRLECTVQLIYACTDLRWDENR